jgi:hypothetical protein
VVGRHAYGAQALEELEQIVRFIAQDDSQSAISSRADRIGKTEGKAAIGSCEQAGKRVSFNQESEIRNIKSLLRCFSSVKKVAGSMTTTGTMQCALCN